MPTETSMSVLEKVFPEDESEAEEVLRLTVVHHEVLCPLNWRVS